MMMLHKPCTCVHPDPLHCTAQRHQADLTLIACLDAACQCRCHFDHQGVAVLHNKWDKQRDPELLPTGQSRRTGPRNSNAKITVEQASEIRALGETLSQGEIARRYSISTTTVHRILHGERWRERKPA